MVTELRARVLHTTRGSIDFPVIEVEDGVIVRLEPGAPHASREIWTTSFFDVHVHGAVNHDFMTADAAGIDRIGRFLASRGVAYYLATTVTASVEGTLRALDRLGKRIQASGARDAATPVGVHLEGPFLCPAKKGAHPPSQLLAPSIETFDQFVEAAQGTVRLITMAPELPGALELIRHAVARGVRVSLGHSNATRAETLAGIAAGATTATHTFNAMRAVDHREPGLAATVLEQEELFAEAICDGVHVHPSMIRLWYRMKGRNRGILVTDGMSATGMPDGTYQLGDLQVEVKNGVCLLGGVLAGSVLTLDRAVENLGRFADVPLATAVLLASRNPAQMIGLADLCETAAGSPAHFNIYDEQGKRVGTMLHGERLPV